MRLGFTDQAPQQPGPDWSFTDPRENIRARALIGPQRAPDPIRDGDTPARPSRHQVFQAVRVRQWRSVMRDAFWVPLHTQQPKGADMPRGHQLPHRIRHNIPRMAPEAYGAMFTYAGTGAPYNTGLIPLPT